MQATWLTRDGARKFYNIASRNALEIVIGAFPDWPESRCRALLEICKFNWDRGPIPTAAILSRTAGLILSAWEMRDHIAGVMLVRDGDGYTPIYLHRIKLAFLMQTPNSLWVEFDPALKELE